ncbi:MAG: hypothetical protein CMB52_01395 [Euryarchaeota archaeon]|nr:hypothetical protein [Euryarchaeota archaeon]
MTEDVPEEEETNDGLVFHEGMRLTDMKIRQNLSIEYPRLEPLHHLKIELMFHYYKIRNTWNLGHWITVGIGVMAIILSGWDLGVGDLSSGGDVDDYFSTGGDFWNEDSGIRNVSFPAAVLTLATVAAWAIFLVRIWAIFPLMRSQSISLFLALFAAQLTQFWAHGMDSNFPFGGRGDAIAIMAVGTIVITFIGFILKRAVTDTRDLHVEERHWHPDPRQVDLALRDHSLIAWTVALLMYCVVIMVHAWAGAHYVSVRQPSEVEWWGLLKIVHLATGILVVWLIMHILWFPQIMLGTSELTIQSEKARQVGPTRTTSSDSNSPSPARSGKCPDCGEPTPVEMRANGEINAACGIVGCNGNGAPGEKCNVCGTRVSSRIICSACNTSAPVGSHFSDEEAW